MSEICNLYLSCDRWIILWQKLTKNKNECPRSLLSGIKSMTFWVKQSYVNHLHELSRFLLYLSFILSETVTLTVPNTDCTINTLQMSLQGFFNLHFITAAKYHGMEAYYLAVTLNTGGILFSGHTKCFLIDVISDVTLQTYLCSYTQSRELWRNWHSLGARTYSWLR